MNAILELSKNSNVTVSETSVVASEVTKAVLDGTIVTKASLRIAELEKELMAARAEQEKEMAAEKKRIQRENERKEWEAAYSSLERTAKQIKELRESSKTDRNIFNKNRNNSVVFLINKWLQSHECENPNSYHDAFLRDLAREFCYSKYNRGNKHGIGWAQSTAYSYIMFLTWNNIGEAKCSPEFVDRLFDFLTDIE